MSKVYIKSNRPNTFISFLIEAVQPIISTIIPIVKKELETNSVYVAKAAVSAPVVIPKMEYFIYIKRFGPPSDGIFDEQALNAIREEFGLPIPVPEQNPYPKADGKIVPVPDTDFT